MMMQDDIWYDITFLSQTSIIHYNKMGKNVESEIGSQQSQNRQQ